jgi:PAS domain S-box-containing protein
VKNARIAPRHTGAIDQADDAPPGHDRAMVERLLAAFEHLRESIVLTDPDDRFVLANQAFRDLNRNVAHAIQAGQKFEDYIRAGLAAGNYPEAVGREEEWLAARLEERRNPGHPVERQRSGGRWFLIDDRRLPDGSTIRFGTEITERKRAEASLGERNRDLQLVVDSVPVMITRLDREERFLFANRAYTDMMELAADNIIGRKIADLVAPEVYAQIKPALDRALSGDPVSVERTQFRTNGEQLVIEGRYIPDVDVRGRVIGLIAVHRDITAERHAGESLAQSEARFRSLTALSSDWYWEQDAQFRYVYMSVDADSRGAMSMTTRAGKTRWELPSTGVSEAQWAAHRAQLEAHEVFHDFEVGRQGPNGDTVWVSVSGEPIFDAGGRFTGYRGITRNITKEVLARARIERMNAELEERVETRTAELREAVKELDAFTYSVSHDLRAPIGAVSGFAHLLRGAEAERLSEDGLRLLGFIEHNAERMTRLIEGLLRFSRLGRSDLRRARVSMNGLAAESLLDFVDEAARTRLAAGAMPDCNGDPALLSQVWSNLLGNAIKYSRGVEAPCIDIGWDAARGAYFVRDNGAGFDMAYAGKLFGVFERLHAETEFEGSGIGLAIAERIVRLHGGAIWAEAAPGRGATFWFTVPDDGDEAAADRRAIAVWEN